MKRLQGSIAACALMALLGICVGSCRRAHGGYLQDRDDRHWRRSAERNMDWLDRRLHTRERAEAQREYEHGQERQLVSPETLTVIVSVILMLVGPVGAVAGRRRLINGGGAE